MFRQRLVRQSALSNSSSSAVSNSSSTESTKMPSPPFIRKRRSTQDSKLYRPLSSDSLDHLLIAASSSPSSSNESRKLSNRRHSIACGVLYVDRRPSLKSAINSAVRRMSDACCLHLSSAPSSTYNLSAPAHTQPVPKKEGEVVLPQSLGTFRQNRLAPPKPSSTDRKYLRSKFQNRRFSTDPPPPSYSEATSGWKQAYPRQKYLPRQQDIVTSSASSASGEEHDRGKPDL